MVEESFRSSKRLGCGCCISPEDLKRTLNETYHLEQSTNWESALLSKSHPPRCEKCKNEIGFHCLNEALEGHLNRKRYKD